MHNKNAFAAGLSLALMVICSVVYADDSQSAPDFSLRLAKAPDASDASKPATVTYQRNDGGHSDYVTEGAAISHLTLAQGIFTIGPSLTWNRNTLASTPTDTWKAQLDTSYVWLYCESCTPNTDRLKWGASVGQQRDMIKDANAALGRLDATWYTHFLELPPNGTFNYGALRPTVTLFNKDVRNAAVDKVTGIAPTGTMSGTVAGVSAFLNVGRWHLDASTQSVHVSHPVAGDVPSNHHLSSVAIRYEFVDAPRTSEELKDKAAQWVPALSLSRQVGDDPLNNVARAGFMQIAFTLQY